MAKKADGQNTYPVNINYFAEKCRSIESSGLNLSLKSENPTESGVWFRIHHGMSMASYGEKITITLTPTPGGTNVHILSECGMPTQVIDYGKNKKNVAVIFKYFEDGMQSAGVVPSSAPQQTAPQTQMQQQTAPQQQAFMFCKNCGKKLPAGSRFCNACGTKLN